MRVHQYTLSLCVNMSALPSASCKCPKRIQIECKLVPASTSKQQASVCLCRCHQCISGVFLLIVTTGWTAACMFCTDCTTVEAMTSPLKPCQKNKQLFQMHLQPNTAAAAAKARILCLVPREPSLLHKLQPPAHNSI